MWKEILFTPSRSHVPRYGAGFFKFVLQKVGTSSRVPGTSLAEETHAQRSSRDSASTLQHSEAVSNSSRLSAVVVTADGHPRPLNGVWPLPFPTAARPPP